MINDDRVSGGDESCNLKIDPERYAYIHVARKVNINGSVLGEGDGARIHTEQSLSFAEGEDAEVMAFDLRPNEHPEL